MPRPKNRARASKNVKEISSDRDIDLTQCSNEVKKWGKGNKTYANRRDRAFKSRVKRSSESDGNDCQEYVVEKIMRKRINTATSKTEYFIKWAGWSERSNTWEPAENLSCPKLLAQFEENCERMNVLKRSTRRSVNPEANDPQPSTSRRTRRSTRITRDRSPSPKPSAFKENTIIEEVHDSDLQPPKTVSQLRESPEFQEMMTPEMMLAFDESDEPDSIEGFDRGLQPEKITGAIRFENQLLFMIKWKGCKKLDIVPAREANLKCPDVVIDYYQRRLRWVPGQ
ncbi:chromobox protein homolog 1-like [Brevipalpus obovatus]|uniref:chromobox protein homolog 1-like n=1 Tax=Brevipalpus obovatus TaxID=246614 RepID=UPI003D9EA56F